METVPGGKENLASWKAPEKKPFNPALMEETLRDIRQEDAAAYRELPAPPVGDDNLPTFLGHEIETPRAERTAFELGELDIDSLISKIKESPNTPPKRDILADTLPSARIERASDYKDVPPPVESQPEENIGMKGEKLTINGAEYEVPPVLDPAIEAILESPEHLPLMEAANNPKELSRYLSGVDPIFAKEVVLLWKLRSELTQMPHLSDEHRAMLSTRGRAEIAENIKRARVETTKLHQKRAA